MPYLREFIKQAPNYNVNMIQISHDIMMYSYQVLDDPVRRADINDSPSPSKAGSPPP
jgi:hypothetical protein